MLLEMSEDLESCPYLSQCLLEVGEFEASLNRLCSGDLGLVDSINAMQLAMQATVSQVGKYQLPCPLLSSFEARIRIQYTL